MQIKLSDIIFQHLVDLRSTPSGWKKRNCMMCHHRGHRPDKRQRFGLKISETGEIGVHCFNCGFSSRYVPGLPLSRSFQDFLRAIHVPDEQVNKIAFELYKLSKINGDVIVDKELVKYKPLEQEWHPKALPENALYLEEWAENDCNDPDFLKVFEYCIERNIYKPQSLLWCPEVGYNKRFILPFYYNNNTMGYTARYAGTPPNKNVPKYYNQEPVNFIYNLDRQRTFDRKYVILTEGVLDAYVVDGISCFGNHINERQVNAINRLNKQIVVCPDRDKDGSVLINIALQQGWSVSFPKWNANIKDAADAAKHYGRILCVKSILEEIQDKEFNIKLLRKMDNYEEQE